MFVTIALVLWLGACVSWKQTGLIPGTERETQRKSDVAVSLKYARDYFGRGPDAQILKITIKNGTSGELSDCVLIIDHKYEARLENILFHFGFFKGNKPFGQSVLRKGEEVMFQFCHDCGNHGALYDPQERKSAPPSIIPQTISLRTGSGIIDWDLRGMR